MDIGRNGVGLAGSVWVRVSERLRTYWTVTSQEGD